MFLFLLFFPVLFRVFCYYHPLSLSDPSMGACLSVSLFLPFFALFWVVLLQISKSSFSDVPAPRGEGGGE